MNNGWVETTSGPFSTREAALKFADEYKKATWAYSGEARVLDHSDSDGTWTVFCKRRESAD